MRLDKYLANSGIGTRSEVKTLVKKKLIKVNGEIIKSPSINVDENKDVVTYDDQPVIYKEFYYVLLNKPKGYVSAVEDNLHPPVTDLVSEFAFANLFPVGRLDIDTTGTLLLTNDGDLCHKLLAPKYHVDKTYSVTTDLEISSRLVKKFKEGIILDGELTLPGDLVILDANHAELTIHQGKFHQVKRMFQHFGLKVLELDRKTFAFLDSRGLELGQYRELEDKEIESLKALVEGN